MEGLPKKETSSGKDLDSGWREAVRQSLASLRREGFSVPDLVRGLRARGARRAGVLLAARGPHIVRVIVLLDRGVDSGATRARVRAAHRRRATRAFVPRFIRRRTLSRGGRWG